MPPAARFGLAGTAEQERLKFNRPDSYTFVVNHSSRYPNYQNSPTYKNYLFMVGEFFFLQAFNRAEARMLT
jgi:hypothetical protein